MATRFPIYRFAPSPNGELHLGHAYSAWVNHRLARAAGGTFLLRLEDIDRARCTPAYERQIEDDLAFLGIEWDALPRRQSEHFADYAAALDALGKEGLIYPAFLSRGDIRSFAQHHEEETGNAWLRDPDGAPIYPGLDRALSPEQRRARMAAGEPCTLRLDMEKAVRRVGRLTFHESGASPQGKTGTIEADPLAWGDVVLARKDMPTSYHLAVTLDDALQGVTHIVRGRDLFEATSVHRVLQALLGVPVPHYHHHDLILGTDGCKLSKSAGDVSLKALRADGLSAGDIARRVGLDPHHLLSRESAARR